MVPVPEISISLAPPVEPVKEPYSPFSPVQHLKEPDSPRPALLSPPPVISPYSPRKLSPLRPADAGRGGIDQDRFEAMLRATRERNASVCGKRSPDLRKEIAMKMHKSKQVERRALFLSKVMAPPSPTATFAPKTPPESPAVFHYSLPSPGLESPIAVFETMGLESPYESPRLTWVEQVDYRMPGANYGKCAPRSAPVFKRKQLPSLAEITARLSFNVSGPDSGLTSRNAGRLPAFLRSDARAENVTVQDAPKLKRPLPLNVGRLQFPSRINTATSETSSPTIHSPKPCLPPPSPSTATAPELEVVTQVVPRTPFKSPTEFTEDNVRALAAGSRERTAHDMLTRLRRRTVTPPTPGQHELTEAEERKLRRHSAPPELQQRERTGFTTPKLNLPGAF
ncbi:hypothetical protein K474DRAFT_834316 [Panus rudis PR-1116 ss-1]|nr:hypothetical protein K474DRAFT_834316 [Panus rudis PR-1116 ss-1]